MITYQISFLYPSTGAIVANKYQADSLYGLKQQVRHFFDAGFVLVSVHELVECQVDWNEQHAEANA